MFEHAPDGGAFLAQPGGGASAWRMVHCSSLVATIGPVISPYDPIKPTGRRSASCRRGPLVRHQRARPGRLRAPGHGARASLFAGVVSVIIAFTVGVPFGIIPGYVGGILDTAAMRVVDALLAIPFLILAIALPAFLGPSLTNAMIAIGVSSRRSSPGSRGADASLRSEEYHRSGAVDGRPTRSSSTTSSPTRCRRSLVQATLSIAAAIIAEAALAFLGLGQQPPAASWGSMLNSARCVLGLAPWMAIYPGSRDLPDRPRLQSPGRRIARRARPEGLSQSVRSGVDRKPPNTFCNGSASANWSCLILQCGDDRRRHRMQFIR